MAEQDGPGQAAQTVKTIVLPASRAALAWDRATDKLVEEAEAEEREAEAAYRQARERYEAAKRQAHYMRQFRQLARVEASSIAPPRAERAVERGSDGRQALGAQVRRLHHLPPDRGETRQQGALQLLSHVPAQARCGAAGQGGQRGRRWVA